MNKLISILFSCLCFFSSAFAQATTLTIGAIGDNPEREIAIFTPFSQYLAQHLKKQGIDHSNIIVAHSIGEMASLMKKGKVDIFVDSAYPSIRVSQLANSIIILRRWKKGEGETSSVVFTKSHSKIKSLQDLQGRTIAFKTPFSTSAYLLPKVSLMEKGYHLVEKSRHLQKHSQHNAIKYVFAKTEENIIYWLLHGKVSAGAMSAHDYAFYSKLKRNKDHLHVLNKSIEIPSQFVSYRHNLPLALALKIKTLLMGMNKNEQGKHILKLFENTTQFDEFPGDNKNKVAALAKVKKLIALNKG